MQSSEVTSHCSPSQKSLSGSGKISMLSTTTLPRATLSFCSVGCACVCSSTAALHLELLYEVLRLGLLDRTTNELAGLFLPENEQMLELTAGDPAEVNMTLQIFQMYLLFRQDWGLLLPQTPCCRNNDRCTKKSWLYVSEKWEF